MAINEVLRLLSRLCAMKEKIMIIMTMIIIIII